MAGVNVPQNGSDGLGAVLPIAGSAVGGVFGGPAGAAVGGKVAGMATQKGPSVGAVQSTAGDTSAIDRRLQSLQSDPSVQLAQADAALKQLPPEYQQQYGPTIAAARQRDAMGGA